MIEITDKIYYVGVNDRNKQILSVISIIVLCIYSSLVSTIGAGDNFNAGFVYGLIKYGITKDMIDSGLDEEQWDHIIRCAQLFSVQCCKSINNYVDQEFGAQMQNEMTEYLSQTNEE